jgi:hypothetical protein
MNKVNEKLNMFINSQNLNNSNSGSASNNNSRDGDVDMDFLMNIINRCNNNCEEEVGLSVGRGGNNDSYNNLKQIGRKESHISKKCQSNLASGYLSSINSSSVNNDSSNDCKAKDLNNTNQPIFANVNNPDPNFSINNGLGFTLRDINIPDNNNDNNNSFFKSFVHKKINNILSNSNLTEKLLLYNLISNGFASNNNSSNNNIVRDSSKFLNNIRKFYGRLYVLL